MARPSAFVSPGQPLGTGRMTDGNAPILSQCDTVFIDSTFRTAQRPYKPLVTIHGLLRGTVLPLRFCLVSGKTVERLDNAHVQQRVRKTSHRNWRPSNAICDFDIALVTVIQTELPRTRVHGSHFHFSQSLWRRVSVLGLVTQYRSQSRVHDAVDD